MIDQIKYLMGMSCIIPAAIGIYRFRKIEEKYYPFVFMMILDVVAEVINSLTAKLRFDNIYLILTLGIYLFFVNTNQYLNKKWLIVFLSASVIVTSSYWIQHGIVSDISYYEVFFISLIILIISIEILTRQISSIKKKIFNNFWFWFSISSILSYGYALLLFAIFFFALKNTPNGKAINNIWSPVNFLCYVLYSVAILKIPQNTSSPKSMRKVEYDWHV